MTTRLNGPRESWYRVLLRQRLGISLLPRGVRGHLDPGLNIDAYGDALVVLGTAAIVMPVVRRWGVSPILGYLGAGALLGPLGLGTFFCRHPSDGLPRAFRTRNKQASQDHRHEQRGR